MLQKRDYLIPFSFSGPGTFYENALKPLADILLQLLIEGRDVILVPVDPGQDRERDGQT
jgi:hypothetical protein